MYVYIAEALRFGSSDSHHYIISVRSELETAIQDAKEEELNRGGKYDCVVWKCTIDQSKVIDGLLYKELVYGEVQYSEPWICMKCGSALNDSDYEEMQQKGYDIL